MYDGAWGTARRHMIRCRVEYPSLECRNNAETRRSSVNPAYQALHSPSYTAFVWWISVQRARNMVFYQRRVCETINLETIHHPPFHRLRLSHSSLVLLDLPLLREYAHNASLPQD